MLCLRRIREIQQNSEEQVGLAIGQVADFKMLDKLFRARLRIEQCGNDHGSAVLLNNAFGKVHSGQRPWRNQERNDPVGEHERRT